MEEAEVYTPKKGDPVRLSLTQYGDQAVCCQKEWKETSGVDGKKQEKHNPGPGDTHKPEWETDQET